MLTYFIRSIKCFSPIQFHLVNVPSLSTADTIKTISQCIYSNLQHHFAGRKCKHKTIFHPLTRMNLSEPRQNSRHNSTEKKKKTSHCYRLNASFCSVVCSCRLVFLFRLRSYPLFRWPPVCVCGCGSIALHIHAIVFAYMQIFSLDLMNRSSVFS